MLVRITDTNTGHSWTSTLEAAAETARLSVEDVVWALEEHGECATMDFLIEG